MADKYKGERYGNRGTRDEGRSIKILDERESEGGILKHSKGLVVFTEVIANPKNPATVGDRRWMLERTLLRNYKKESH